MDLRVTTILLISDHRTPTTNKLFILLLNIKEKSNVESHIGNQMQFLFLGMELSSLEPLFMSKPTPKSVDPATVPQLAGDLVKKVRFPMLATMDGDQARVRPVSPVRTDGFVVYVANLKSYGKTGEIMANPKVELCYLDEDHNQVRITGTAEVVSDRSLLEDIWNANRLLQHYLGSVDNPDLIVYRINPNRVRFMLEWALEYHEVQF